MVYPYGLRTHRGGIRRNIPPSPYVKHLSQAQDMEQFQQEIRDRLMEYTTDKMNNADLELEPMTRSQRKLVHAIAAEIELRTQSYGPEHNRRIRVMKTRFNKMINLTDTQRIRLKPEQISSMLDYLDEDPVQYADLEEHHKPDPRGRGQFRSGVNLPRAEPVIPPAARTSAEMERFQERLPTTRFRDEILQQIDQNNVTIITGGTGCGKTTQVPQFLLEKAHRDRQPIRIVCTQPRRLPAIAVSERVARERGEQLGDTVGYHIRLEQKLSHNTSLIYCTSGILLRMLTLDDSARDITHIILDEVHEREQNTDYLLIVLREALKKRDDLKVILMSATMEGNRETFLRYFREYDIGVVEIPSRLHSVEKFYLGEVLALTGYMPNNVYGGTFNADFDNIGSPANNNSFPPIEQFQDQPMYPTSYNDQLHQTQTVPDLQRYQQHYGQSGWQNAQSQQSMYPQYPPSIPYHHQQSMPIEPMGVYSGMQRSTTVPANLDGMQNGYPPMAVQSTHWDPSMYQESPVYSAQSPYAAQSYNQYNNGWNMQQSSYYEPPANQTSGQSSSRDPKPSIHQQTPTNKIAPINSRTFRFGQRAPQENIRLILNKMLPNRPEFFTPEFVPILKRADLDEKYLISTYLKRGGQQWTDSVDPKLVLAVIEYCLDSPVQGAILVFLPGYDDIMTIRDMVQQLKGFRTRPLIFTLHSQMNSQDQQKVFDPSPPGTRKLILSTNIAEASLTIDGVVFVVDSGKVKEKAYDHNTRISELKTISIAQSNAEQRCGRAGRTQNGFCFRLYSRDEFDAMNVTQLAEMKRVAIHEICLHAKMFAPERLSVRRLLERAPEPPDAEAVNYSLRFLEEIGALYTFDRPVGTNYYNDKQPPTEPDITDLGRIIAHLPLEPQLARLLLFGVALKVFQPIVSLVAALSHREPFVLPMGEDRQAAFAARDTFSRLDYSDHLMLIRALNQYNSYSPSSRQALFCRQHYLSPQAMKMIVGVRRQLFGELKRLHLIDRGINSIDDQDLNMFSHSWPMIQAAIVAGCFPGMGIVRSGTKLRKIHTSVGSNANLHPSSSLRRQVQTNYRPETLNKYAGNGDEPEIEYLAFQELSRIDEQLTLRVVTAVTPMAALFFAGPIRLAKSVTNEFEVAEEDYDSDLPRADVGIPTDEDDGAPDFGENDDLTPPRFKREYYVETTDGLGFRGQFRPLQAALRLRLKLMSYFLNFLKQPLRPLSSLDSKLLQTIANVLEIDHQRVNFHPVTDLYTPRPQQTKFTTSKQTVDLSTSRQRPQSPSQISSRTPEFGDSPPADPAPSNVPQPTDIKSSPQRQQPPPRRSYPTNGNQQRWTKTNEAAKSAQLIAQVERAQNGTKRPNNGNGVTERANEFFHKVGIHVDSPNKLDENKEKSPTAMDNLFSRHGPKRNGFENQSGRKFQDSRQRPGKEIYVPPAQRKPEKHRESGEQQRSTPFNSRTPYRSSKPHPSHENRDAGAETSKPKSYSAAGHRYREVRNSNRQHTH
ncbi:hypothetical protein M3Y94_00483800 [Aphelenchoides besseyi]|nr:hypothetical protein M3Y94_00483800 [Aphelenchoides besseyi]KAI6217424.1 putative ATP-dependent RNA helicase YTHDC2 [Aphelenchoides besseyi]